MSVYLLFLFAPEKSNLNYTSQILRPNQYGVVTGWGRKCDNMQDPSCNPHNEMKQMQMEVQEDDECIKNLTDKKKSDVNATIMFCAGSQSK